jgi:SAM-dependent methyltransferase
MENLNPDFWNQRYANEETGWDLKSVSPPIQQYFDLQENKNLHILIPGAGNAWEAEHLFKSGFANVHVLDYAALAVENFKNRFPDFPAAQVHCEDFFQHKGQYDCIVEQTFFCALNPNLRKDYVMQMHRLLKPGGILVGLLFNDPLNEDKPPFGGNEKEYRKLFESYFILDTFQTAINSIAPRAGREFFIRFRAKKQ